MHAVFCALQVLKTLGFDMHVPTVFWFTSTYLCIAGFEEDGPARLISQYPGCGIAPVAMKRRERAPCAGSGK